MFFRNISCSFTLLLLLLQIQICFTGEAANVRSRRDEKSDGFGKMFMDFLSNLFDSNTNQTETVEKPMNGSFNESVPQNVTSGQNNFTEIQENSTLTNLQTQKQEVTSQDNRTLTNANLTSEASSTVTSSPKEPTPTDHNKCYDDPLLRNFCEVPDEMYYWSLWDVYYVLFSDRVVNALIKTCPRASWCLQSDWESDISERVDAVMDSTSKVAKLCQSGYEPCLSNIVSHFENCYKYNYFMITFEALKLVCGLKKNTVLTSSCYVTVETVLHVTHADLIRTDVQQNTTEDTCQSPEANMARYLICSENACPGESKTFHGFEPWTWFISAEDDLMIECKMDPSKCDILQITANTTTQGTGAQTTQAATTQTTSKATTSSFSSSTTWSTYSWAFTSDAAQLEQDICYNDAILQNYCSVPDDLADLSFWDLYSILFSDSVLDALMTGCTKGSWCLQDNQYDYWEALVVERVDMVMMSEIATSMCKPGVQPCIRKVANAFFNCSVYEQMSYTTEVVKLVCGLKQKKDLSETCYKHVLSAAHVTLADTMRSSQNEKEMGQDTCVSPEADMTKNLICVENSCPGEVGNFRSFRPWAWFTSVVNDLIIDCDLDPTTCKAMLTPPSAYLEGTMIGIIVAIVITSLTLSVAVCMVYKRYRRNAVVKEGYQRLLTEGDES